MMRSDIPRELSWPDWDKEYRAALEFYLLVGLPRIDAEFTAQREMRRKYYVLAGG